MVDLVALADVTDVPINEPDFVLRVDGIRDTDSGVLITETVVAVIVLKGVPGSYQGVWQGTSVAITSGVLEIVDGQFAADIGVQHYVALIGNNNRLGLLPAVVVDRNV
jgi:hypothetical protein